MSRDLNGKKQPVMGRKEDMEKEHSRQREQPVERPWGRTVAGKLQEQQGGPCGQSRASKGQRGRKQDQKGQKGWLIHGSAGSRGAVWRGWGGGDGEG